ncbi:FG-GAP repeat protein [Streptomyces sp. PSKA28]|uniref:FG-GAP repeat protein n=2 Tax=Streptomyces TaxID=1883 RepID=A0A7W0DPR1_9ACTN|nr:FG-GAP repeat protein [Streptomyces himalayensis subsp. himalayensis]
MSRRTSQTHAYRPLSLKRRAWLTLGAVVLGGGGVVTYAVAGPSGERPETGKEARPASVHSMKLEARGTGRKGVDKQETERFSGLLLTWKGANVALDGTAEARARSTETGDWSGWKPLAPELAADGAEAKRAGALGGTEVLWTGASDAVEVRVTAADGTTSALPEGIALKLIDPGTTAKEAQAPVTEPAAYSIEETTPAATPTDTAAPADGSSPSEPAGPAESNAATDTASPSPTDPSGSTSASPTASTSPSASASPTPTIPTAPPSTVVKPPVITQAQWGASTKYNGTPEYATEVKAVVVHHTGVDVDNQTSCVHSAERVRTIQQGHLAKGWFDIGYHFLVDRCGQIFEGRSGGMDLPVRGAHDYGFNTDTIGVSFLANTETVKPTRAAMDAIARVAAWRLGQYGANPAGTVTLTSAGDKGVDGNLIPKGQSVTLPRIFGHRDTNATACPGKNLYAKLPLIRSLAASPGISHALPTTDFNRDGVTDLVAGTPRTSGVGNLTVVPGGEEGPVASAKRTISQNSAGVPGSSESGDNFGAATAWGDVNGDGYADLAVGAPGEDDTSGNADRGAVTVLYGPGLSSGTSHTTTGVTAAGAKLGSAVAVGDFNADGKADVFAAGTGKGGNWNALLTGGATKYGTLTTATGSIAWADAAAGDFNRDGYADVALNYRDASGVGRVTWFKGSATGLVKVSTLSVKGGRSIAAGDVNGNGYDDIVIGQPYTSESGAKSGGQVTMVPGTSTGFTTTGMTTIHQDTTSVPGTNESGDAMGSSVSVGDYNLDGYADVLTGAPNEDITRSGVNQSNAGTTWLIKGTSSGLTGSGALEFHQDTSGIAGSTEANDKFGSSVVLQDLSGWGRADLAIGAEGEDGYDGTILQLDSGSAGISTSGGVYYGRSALGTLAGVHLGQVLTP